MAEQRTTVWASLDANLGAQVVAGLGCGAA
jgi:hypothetical protein